MKRAFTGGGGAWRWPRDVSRRFGLPPLPASAILLRSHVSDPRLARSSREFTGAVKRVLNGR